MLVRKDLPIEQQIVQCSHVAFEAGQKSNTSGTFQVLCETTNEASLLEAEKELINLNIPYILFTEPDINNEATAIATLPLEDKQRKQLKHWKLWKYDKKNT